MKRRVRIDISGVPSKVRLLQAFKTVYNDLHDGLLNEAEVDAVCIHEAGHEIYFQEAGFSEFDRHGPRIICGPSSIVGTAASVQPRRPAVPVAVTPEWLFLVAKACAAAGVYSRSLTPSSKRDGDGEDIERLQGIYKAAKTSLPEDTWELAQDAVLKELEASPARQTLAWERAREIKDELFGYLFRSSSQ